MWRSILVALVATTSALALPLTISPASAQAIPKSLQEGGTETSIKNRKNTWTVKFLRLPTCGPRLRRTSEAARIAIAGSVRRSRRSLGALGRTWSSSSTMPQ
jgi:hypothetical protein